MRKDFFRLMPACRRGREMAAPSGKFWMPMPRARAMAAGRRVGSLRAARAKEMPTAIPSGMLCMAMASTSRVLRRPEPSRGAWRKAGVRWGRSVFMVTRNRTPRTEPPAAGNHPGSRPPPPPQWPDEQGPHAGRDHHTGSKAQQELVELPVDPAAKQKDGGRAQSRHKTCKASARCGPNQCVCQSEFPFPAEGVWTGSPPL